MDKAEGLTDPLVEALQLAAAEEVEGAARRVGAEAEAIAGTTKQGASALTAVTVVALAGRMGAAVLGDAATVGETTTTIRSSNNNDYLTT